MMQQLKGGAMRQAAARPPSLRAPVRQLVLNKHLCRADNIDPSRQSNIETQQRTTTAAVSVWCAI